MIDAFVRRAVSAGAVGVLLAGLMGGCTGQSSTLPGCADLDPQLATTLEHLAILTKHPEGAVATQHQAGCDTDDGFSYADQQYRTKVSREGIMVFYRAAAGADGWLADGENPTPVPSAGLVISGAAQCFRKEIGGTTAHLAVWFPGDFTNSADPDSPAVKDVYGLDVTAASDGQAWC